MPIKNYTTKISAAQTVGEIQEMLAMHGAKRVMLEYGEHGKVMSIVFCLDCFGDIRGFRLEPKTAGVMSVMAKDRVKCDEQQAERIAWRNIKDWIAAQAALIETEQAAMEQLFLPMMLADRNDATRTLYDKLQTQSHLLKAVSFDSEVMRDD